LADSAAIVLTIVWNPELSAKVGFATDGSNMSACIISTTALECSSRACANVSLISFTSAFVRAVTSASCSAVGAVWPVHGARLLLLPTT